NNPPDRRGKTFKGAPVMAGPSGLTPQGDVLYENMGGGRFRDATTQRGCVPETPGYGLGVRIFDFDRDGKPDIFVGNDSTENFLFHNLGAGRFEEVGMIAGVAANYDGHTQATMGVAIGDVDGNGYPDLFSTNFSSDTNTLHLNLGDGFFDDRTSQYGLAMMSMPFLSWGTGLYDFDCDGDEDLFIASGHVYPEAAGHSIDSDYEQVPLLLDRRGKRFHRANNAGDMFQKRFSARSTAFGDLDGDGDVDIVMTTLNGCVRVFRNDTPLTNRAVVELIGPAGNRHGYGAMVELTTPSGTQRRWILGGGSFQSVDAPIAYFGLGFATESKLGKLSLRVTWPDGKITETTDVPVNHRIRIGQSGEKPSYRKLSGRSR
ncbi:MAG: CRTAC1 family protein, partial [Planctomycetes bacterium]|nr:CRTAC1 family protein [Planctomycetota bacterium]